MTGGGLQDPASPAPASAQPPSIPAEFLKKLAEAEDLVAQLQQQNLSQREELDNIHQSLEREARMKKATNRKGIKMMKKSRTKGQKGKQKTTKDDVPQIVDPL